MVFSYADLKGKIKVGDRVRAAQGKANHCRQLENDGSNIQKITDIVEGDFEINYCMHSFYNNGGFLDLIDYKKDMTMLEVGDRVKIDDDGGIEMEVLTVLHRNGQKTLYVMSRVHEFNDAGSLFTAHELNESGYTIVDQEPEPTITEMTLEEVAELKGIPVEQLRIKE